MPIAEREADVVWEGTLARGKGTLSTGSGVIADREVTWAARTEEPGGKTSPEELIAAAHASCFSMALSLELGEVDATPERLSVHAVCTFDEVDGAPRVTRSVLTVSARVGGIDQEGFDRAIAAAEELCPVANALRGNVEMSVDATLEAS